MDVYQTLAIALKCGFERYPSKQELSIYVIV